MKSYIKVLFLSLVALQLATFSLAVEDAESEFVSDMIECDEKEFRNLKKKTKGPKSPKSTKSPKKTKSPKTKGRVRRDLVDAESEFVSDMIEFDEKEFRNLKKKTKGPKSPKSTKSPKKTKSP